MSNKQKADILMFIHLAVIGLMLISPILIFIISWWSYLVVVAVLLIMVPWPIFGGCWLANIEKHYRLLDKPNSKYKNQSFTQHYLEEFFGIKWSRAKVRYYNIGFYLIALLVAVVKIGSA